mmetsp:Transcript_2984/g.9153  ORF Transcript_2984/g.9153 Transcript_2984/m.9153 type:complete len:118 (+) Transcript_2984:732-1085(+)
MAAQRQLRQHPPTDRSAADELFYRTATAAIRPAPLLPPGTKTAVAAASHAGNASNPSSGALAFIACCSDLAESPFAVHLHAPLSSPERRCLYAPRSASTGRGDAFTAASHWQDAPQV